MVAGDTEKRGSGIAHHEVGQVLVYVGLYVPTVCLSCVSTVLILRTLQCRWTVETNLHSMVDRECQVIASKGVCRANTRLRLNLFGVPLVVVGSF